MILDPDSYTCPEHQADLTPLVLEVLEEDGPPGANTRRPPLAFSRPPWLRKAAGPREFQVVVVCPGTEASEAHDRVCYGTYIP